MKHILSLKTADFDKAIHVLLFFFIIFSSNLLAQLPPETIWGVPQDPTPLAVPGYLQSVQGNNLQYTRLGDVTVFSDFAGFNFQLPDGSTRHQYAKTQAWNADESMLYFGTVFFLNGNDYTLNKTITWAGLNDGRWSNSDPDILYFCDDKDFKCINVNTEVVTLLHSFPDYDIARIGPYEGHLSADNRYVIITDADANSRGTKASVYDIVNDEVLGTFSGHFDWATMTPSGDYVVVSNDETNRIERYDLQFQNMFVLIGGQEHGDFAVDVNGDEVFVQVIPLSMTRLSDGLNTDLLPATAATSGTCGDSPYNPNIAGHISGRNFDLPGWAYVSAGDHICYNNQGYDWRTEIFAIKLDYTGLGTIRDFGYSHTSRSESVATVNHDGTKVLFASDWDIYGAGLSDNLTYLVEYNPTLPVSWLLPLSAKVNGHQASLHFSTNSQINNKHFIIEHSLDGKSFQMIDQIDGELNLNTTKNYHLIHKTPAEGDNFYRIKQVDFDDRYSYSNIAHVFYQKDDIVIFPNPTSGKLKIETTNPVNYEVAVFDMTGRLVLTQKNNHKSTFDLTVLPDGIYVLEIQNKENQQRVYEKILLAR